MGNLPTWQEGKEGVNSLLSRGGVNISWLGGDGLTVLGPGRTGQQFMASG